MKRLIALLLCLQLSTPGFAQVYSQMAIQNTTGNWLKASPGALVYLCTAGTTNNNCLAGIGTVPLFTNQNLNVSQTNPITADANGNYTIFTIAGIYLQCIQGATSYCQIIQVGGSSNGVPLLFRTNSPNGTTLNQLVTYDTTHLDSNSIATVQNAAVSSKGVIGVCIAGCGTSGIATIGTYLSAMVTLDGTGVVGDVISPSASVAGFGSDEGSITSQPNVQTVGRISKANVGGAGTQAQIDFFLGDLNSPGSSSSSGQVTNCSSGSGANAYYPGIGTVVSCDPLITDSGNGFLTLLGANFNDGTFGGYYNQQQGTLPPLSAANRVYYSPGPTVGTTYGIQPFATPPTVGNCVDIAAGDAASWIKLHDSGNPCGTGTGGGTTKTGNPVIPVATVNGTPGSTDYKYAVVGCEDPACSRHTAISPIVDVATGAATITNVNSITLKSYGDTLYGIRGYLICRTSSSGTPATTGVLTGALIAGKQFIDTGLAGDGTNCASVYASNNTQLNISDDALPGCNVPSTRIGGPDAPPCTMNALDDEMQQTFGAPCDINDPFWTCVNFGSATASFSKGAIVLASDTTASNNLEMLAESASLPSTPFEFTAFVSAKALSTFSGCGIGLRESSSGKLVLLMNYQNAVVNAGAASTSGRPLAEFTGTSPTVLTTTNIVQYMGDAYYLRVKDDGTNITFSYSPDGDGVDFYALPVIAISGNFTSAPNQLFIAVNSSATGARCTFDFVRRTQ